MSVLSDDFAPLMAGMSILIVDDNEDTADALGLLLEQYGCDVRLAYDGERALALLREFKAALILLDITMPRVDGYAACQRVRAEHGDGVYVAALTGWAKEEDRAKALSAGFDDHIAKPIAFERLVKVVCAARRKVCGSEQGALTR